MCSLDADNSLSAYESQCEMHFASLDGSLGPGQVSFIERMSWVMIYSECPVPGTLVLTTKPSRTMVIFTGDSLGFVPALGLM